MEAAYPLLVNPQATTKARLFLTEPVAEYKYLLFSNAIKELMDNMATYCTLTSLSGRYRCESSFLI